MIIVLQGMHWDFWYNTLPICATKHYFRGCSIWNRISQNLHLKKDAQLAEKNFNSSFLFIWPLYLHVQHSWSVYGSSPAYPNYSTAITSNDLTWITHAHVTLSLESYEELRSVHNWYFSFRFIMRSHYFNRWSTTRLYYSNPSVQSFQLQSQCFLVLFKLYDPIYTFKKELQISMNKCLI